MPSNGRTIGSIGLAPSAVDSNLAAQIESWSGIELCSKLPITAQLVTSCREAQALVKAASARAAIFDSASLLMIILQG